MRKIKHKDDIIYAVYQGEQVLSVGTLDEVCRDLKVSRKTIQHMATPSYINRSDSPTRRYVTRWYE